MLTPDSLRESRISKDVEMHERPGGKQEPIATTADTRTTSKQMSDFAARTLIIIPAHNEEECIAGVVLRLLERGFPRIRVVDNASTDHTAERATAAGAEVISHPHAGYGLACWLGGLDVPQDVEWLLYCNADASDDLDALDHFAELAPDHDLILGCRTRPDDRRVMTLPNVSAIGSLRFSSASSGVIGFATSVRRARFASTPIAGSTCGIAASAGRLKCRCAPWRKGCASPRFPCAPFRARRDSPKSPAPSAARFSRAPSSYAPSASWHGGGFARENPPMRLQENLEFPARHTRLRSRAGQMNAGDGIIQRPKPLY